MEAQDSYFFSRPSLDFSVGYTDIEVIHTGSDSHSVVYRARKGARWVVLKGLRADLRDDPLYVELLRKEFDLVFTLDNPHIVRFYSLETVDNLGPCIVMDRVDGTTLAQYLDSHTPTLKEAEAILKELCEALDYIHKRQIIHGDLKPANIMLTADGRHVRLIDFGFSNSHDYATLKISAGTYPFTAPEQSDPLNREIDSRADIYALGRIMELLLPGHRPANYRKAIETCTRKRPHERPSTIAQVTSLLQRKRNRRTLNIALGIVALAAILFFILKPFHRRQVNRSLTAETNIPAAKTTLPGVEGINGLNPDESNQLNITAPEVNYAPSPSVEANRPPAVTVEIETEDIPGGKTGDVAAKPSLAADNPEAATPDGRAEESAPLIAYTRPQKRNGQDIDLRSIHPLAQLTYADIKSRAKDSCAHDDHWKESVRESSIEYISRYLKPGDIGYDQCLYAIDRALSEL